MITDVFEWKKNAKGCKNIMDNHGKNIEKTTKGCIKMMENDGVFRDFIVNLC